MRREWDKLSEASIKSLRAMAKAMAKAGLHDPIACIYRVDRKAKADGTSKFIQAPPS